MRVRHANKATSLVETDKAHKTGLPVAIIAAARRKLRFLRGCLDERDIRALKSNHFEKLKGDRDGEHSVRLNDQWRLTFRIDNTQDPKEIEITAIEDYH